MKKELLDIIRCPACGSSRKEIFNLIERERDSFEIRTGAVRCDACGTSFEIRHGILDLLYKPGDQVLKEIKGIEQAARDIACPQDEDGIISMPDSIENGNPFDPACGVSLNFYRALEELDIKSGRQALDLGSGTTWAAWRLAQRGCSCVASDISVIKAKGLEGADLYLKKEGVYYERVRADMQQLPFADEAFDIVITHASLHHAGDLRKTFNEIFRVLRKNGRLALINEPVCGIFSVRRGAKARHLPNYVFDYAWNENIYSVLDYIACLRRAKFSNVKILYPPSIDLRISLIKQVRPGPSKQKFKYRLAYLASFVWGGRLFRPALKKAVFWIAIAIFGLPLLSAGMKTAAGTRKNKR